MLSSYNDNFEFNDKKDRVEEEIGNETTLQTKILEKNPKKAVELFDLFTDSNWVNPDTIEDEYDFQVWQ